MSRLLVAVVLLASSAFAAAPAARLMPDDLVYEGALRLPEGSGGSSWEWSSEGLAYRAGGDPRGPEDGYPGSLFGVGHDHQAYVSEITIPKPVVSASKAPSALPAATTLQPFTDLRAGHFADYEMYRVGLAVLPPQGEQTSEKLHFGWSQHMGEAETGPSHGWCETDLSKPKVAGMWQVAGLWQYQTTDYLFPIPEAWAKAHTPDLRLVTGRFRDGGQGGKGPNLFAIGPWNHGNPPPHGTTLKATRLLGYSTVYDEANHPMDGYHASDDWAGGAWLTAGDRAAVVLVGTKGLGQCWYGFSNGVVWPEEGPWPPVPEHPHDQRGWWSSQFRARMIFFDPSELAAVAAGKKKSWEPQPYAHLDLAPRFFRTYERRKMRHVGACAFDRERGKLYVVEPRADEDKSLIHVWGIKKP